MGTNKDQLQAHQFMLRRVGSALTTHETDPEQPPFRRPVMAAFGGLVIAVLVGVAIWVFGLLVPRGDRFTATDVIAVEEETGARYVLLNGTLHPVANYTSALLALDRHAPVRMVSRSTLTGIPVGARIGIPDAPDSLPGKDQLLNGGWSVCDQSTVDGMDRSDRRPVLLVGRAPARAVAAGGRAVLAESAGRLYLLYDGHRHEIADRVDHALELDEESRISVEGTWLDTLPLGRPIAPDPVPGAGLASSAVPGMDLRTGQLLEVDSPGFGQGPGAAGQYYLVLRDRLRPVGGLQATIQQALGEHGARPVEVSNRALVGAPRTAPRRPEAGDPPWDRPAFMPVGDPNVAVCATFRPGEVVPRIVLGASLPAADRTTSAGPVRIAVPPGEAALIEVMLGGEERAGGGTVALVTDQGRLYPLADPRHVLAVLGYDGVRPVPITSALADRVPRGQSLSPANARRPIPGLRD